MQFGYIVANPSRGFGAPLYIGTVSDPNWIDDGDDRSVDATALAMTANSIQEGSGSVVQLPEGTGTVLAILAGFGLLYVVTRKKKR